MKATVYGFWSPMGDFQVRLFNPPWFTSSFTILNLCCIGVCDYVCIAFGASNFRCFFHLTVDLLKVGDDTWAYLFRFECGVWLSRPCSPVALSHPWVFQRNSVHFSIRCIRTAAAEFVLTTIFYQSSPWQTVFAGVAHFHLFFSTEM